MIARRTLHLTVFAATLLGVSLAVGLAPLLVWGLAVGGVIAAGLSARGVTRATARLAVDRSRPRVGDTIQVRVEVEARRGWGPLLVHVPLGNGLQLAKGVNLHLFWKGPRPLLTRFEFIVRAATRGPAPIGPVTLHAAHPFRLRAGEDVAVAATEVLLGVEPRVRSVPRVRHLRGYGATLRAAGDSARLGPRGNDFEEVRPYTHGDPLRNVNWKASARLSTNDLHLMVNEFEPEGRKSVWLFLDGGAHMEIGSTHENTLDAALEGALGVLAYFLERGYRAGATIYHQPETRLFYPDVGSRQLGRLQQALATLTAHAGGEGLDRAVLAARGFLRRERPLILLVTRPEVEPDATRRGIAQVRAVTGHGVRGSPILLIAPAPVTHVLASGHHPVTAAALQLAARAMYQDLRRRGVRVIDWDPAHTPLERLVMREVVAR